MTVVTRNRSEKALEITGNGRLLRTYHHAVKIVEVWIHAGADDVMQRAVRAESRRLGEELGPTLALDLGSLGPVFKESNRNNVSAS